MTPLLNRCAVLFVLVLLVGVPRAAWADLPDRRIVLTGTIGEKWAVQLDLHFEGRTISGNYFYSARGGALALEGTQALDRGRVVTLTEFVMPKGVYAAEEQTVTGRWSVAPDETGRRWTGTWTGPDGGKSYPVALTLVAEYDLMARTIAGGRAEAQSPRLIGQDEALARAVDGLADETLRKVNTFLAETRRAHADPALADHFERHHYYHADDWRVEHLESDLVSMYMLHSEYTGGAHPNYSYAARTFLCRQGQAGVVELAWLFRPDSGWRNALRVLIVERLREQEAAWLPDPDAVDEDDMLNEQALSAFTIAPHGLTFYFGPYMFGPYAQGSFVVRVPWNKLDAMVDPQGPAGRWLPLP